MVVEVVIVEVVVVAPAVVVVVVVVTDDEVASRATVDVVTGDRVVTTIGVVNDAGDACSALVHAAVTSTAAIPRPVRAKPFTRCK